jgi:hypothetical protein
LKMFLALPSQGLFLVLSIFLKVAPECNIFIWRLDYLNMEAIVLYVLNSVFVYI